MHDLFSDFDDLAQVLAGKDHRLIKTALEIVYLKSRIETFAMQGQFKQDLDPQLSTLHQELQFLMLDFSNQTLGLK